MVVVHKRNPFAAVVPAMIVAPIALCIGFVAGRATAPPYTRPDGATVSRPSQMQAPQQQASGLVALNSRLEKLAVNLQRTTTAAEFATPVPEQTQAAIVTPPSTVPPPPSFASQHVDGVGQTASNRIHFYSGLYVFQIGHSGSGHFSIWLLDRAGEKVELLVNTSEPFEGSKAVRIPVEGDYLFDVSADGPWQIAIASPQLAADQKSFDGANQAATRAFKLEGGLKIFQLSHSGSGHFGVWLLDGAGNKVELLANTSGSPFSGSKALRVEPGWYVLDVSAERPWSVRIE